ncbi:flagellar basal body rod protein FlgB [Aureimonas phyllosphaerae]|uniref:Flagellar basal body rod protein FlgB n=1 Tax=Aureimonas phyllosphaerae TaxID=1166078 RepID=A0A7W6BZC8_9HYPH|nr:flagellar basal body rod protein FlgB [Aureimonas phyllosphaerae]MBB3935577.1 flagellar basal-body rod protein FlgB [Aureimonas phyllosphaerae]MBB3959585.1 flagellar basal-body rod protein FlgB [Aureimonas phyllosphaerae]SFF12495.1 flagellar basal-body rod protein FlgB [Aureimonas phyllosphaerae]
MSEFYLFGLSSRRAEWLSARQAVVAENVANANTPTYRAKDVTPFSEVLETTALQMSGSNPSHLVASAGRDFGIDEAAQKPWDVTHSGNSVSLEQEMLKAGEVSRDFALSTSVAKSFHRMFMTTLKG